MSDADSWMERYRKFKDSRWSLHPASYQIRNKDGTPGGWISQVNVHYDTFEATTIRRLLEQEPKVYDSKDIANAVAFRCGVVWLEKNADSALFTEQ